EFHLQTGAVLFRENARVVDQHVEPAKGALQKRVQGRDAPGVGDVERVKPRRQRLRGKSLDGLRAGFRLARRQDDLRAARGQLAADSKADATRAAGDDGHRIMRGHDAGSPSPSPTSAVWAPK